MFLNCPHCAHSLNPGCKTKPLIESLIERKEVEESKGTYANMCFLWSQELATFKGAKCVQAGV